MKEILKVLFGPRITLRSRLITARFLQVINLISVILIIVITVALIYLILQLEDDKRLYQEILLPHITTLDINEQVTYFINHNNSLIEKVKTIINYLIAVLACFFAFVSILSSSQNTLHRERSELLYWCNEDKSKIFIFNNKETKEIVFGIYITDKDENLIQVVFEAEHNVIKIPERDFYCVKLGDISIEIEDMRVFVSTHIKREECQIMNKPWSSKSFS